MEVHTSIKSPEIQENKNSPRKGDRVDRTLSLTANVLMISLVFLPQLAHAQAVGGAFGGLTEFLKAITNLLIFEWGYYIGIITLAIQGYRWKTGRAASADRRCPKGFETRMGRDCAAGSMRSMKARPRHRRGEQDTYAFIVFRSALMSFNAFSRSAYATT